MKPHVHISAAAKASIVAIVLLGLLGGAWIIANSGFSTAPKRGGPSTFVPVPEAYLLAAVLYAMSGIALLVLLRDRQASRSSTAIALLVCAAAAVILTAMLRPH